MARRKNTKRIDPRYFLHETVNRGEGVDEAHRPDWRHDAMEFPAIGGGESRPKSKKLEPQLRTPPKPMGDAEAAALARAYGAGAEPQRPDESDEEHEQRLMKGGHRQTFKIPDTAKLEEDCPAGEGGEAIDISAPGTEVHVDDISQLSPEEAFAAGLAAARDAIDQAMGGSQGSTPADHSGQTCEEAHPGEPHAEE